MYSKINSVTILLMQCHLDFYVGQEHASLMSLYNKAKTHLC